MYDKCICEESQTGAATPAYHNWSGCVYIAPIFVVQHQRRSWMQHEWQAPPMWAINQQHLMSSYLLLFGVDLSHMSEQQHSGEC